MFSALSYKLFLLPSLFLLSGLLFTQEIQAQGTWTCVWNIAGGSGFEICESTPVKNCEPGYDITPGEFCLKYGTQPECEQIRECAPKPAPGPGCGDIDTAIGKIPTCSPNEFAAWVLRWALGIGGGVAFLLILWGGIQILTSSGNPEQVKNGREIITAAITGLLLLIFSVFLLRLIGVDILHIPGLEA